MRAVECVVSFFLIGLLGYQLTKRKWFSEDTSILLSRFTSQIVIPLNLFYNINVTTSKGAFLPLLPYMFIPTVSIILVMLIAAAVARGIGMERSHRSVFITACACSNTINIGLPINLILFGSEALTSVLVYYMGNTVMFWTVGNYLLAADAPGGAKPRVFSWSTLRRIFSPQIIAFLAGLFLLSLNVRIPPLLGIAASQVGGMTTPLSILCIGIAIYLAGIRNIRLTRDIALISLGRFVLSPLIVAGLLYFFPVPDIMRKVFILQSSLPPMTNIALLAIQYRSDAKFASIAISFYTLAALLTVPIFMLLIGS